MMGGNLFSYSYFIYNLEKFLLKYFDEFCKFLEFMDR